MRPGDCRQLAVEELEDQEKEKEKEEGAGCTSDKI